MKRFVQVSIVLAILIVALSVAYYLVIFLPQKDKEQLDLQKQVQEQKQMEDKATKDASLQRSLGLHGCIIAADADGTSFWNTECKGLGLGEDCRLPQYNADRVDQSIKDAKTLCFREYPQ
jgi:preprotein translocase subunit YajC